MQTILRISIIFMLLFRYGTNIYSQDILQNEVSLTRQAYVTSSLLDSIQSKTGIVFVYSSTIQPDRLVYIAPGKYTVSQVLDSIFLPVRHNYRVRNRHVILMPEGANVNTEIKHPVQGRVLDRKNNPVPFATIYFENSGKGTIANVEGYFRLLVPAGMIFDTLTISSVGFEAAKISPETYLSQNLLVNLKTAVVPIRDIIVRPEVPEDIVLQSYEKRIRNYSSKQVLMTAFFRETSKQDNDYISLTEALVEVYKTAYLSNADDLIVLLKGRNGSNINKSELVNLVVQGGLYNGIRLDVAKYGSYFYSSDAFLEYDFRMSRTTFIKGRQTYVIAFDMKEGLDYAGYKGLLYFDAESLALVRAEFEISARGLKYAKADLVRKTPRGFSAKPLYARYEVEYRYYNNTWNLHYAHSEINIKVRKSGRRGEQAFSCNFVSTSEFVVTDIDDSPSARARYRDSARPHDVLYQQVKNTGETFWEGSNIILPEEPLLSTIGKLQKEGIIPDEQQGKSNSH
ncbi:MAG: carboxypeptidase-like regulatory domain-containing protein [Bacteroidales bacterium]|nr:carboxypeptidase-like regulatory domain-containing protein [Bacteroidales bacterium]